MICAATYFKGTLAESVPARQKHGLMNVYSFTAKVGVTLWAKTATISILAQAGWGLVHETKLTSDSLNTTATFAADHYAAGLWFSTHPKYKQTSKETPSCMHELVVQTRG